MNVYPAFTIKHISNQHSNYQFQWLLISPHTIPTIPTDSICYQQKMDLKHIHFGCNSSPSMQFREFFLSNHACVIVRTLLCASVCSKCFRSFTYFRMVEPVVVIGIVWDWFSISTWLSTNSSSFFEKLAVCWPTDLWIYNTGSNQLGVFVIRKTCMVIILNLQLKKFVIFNIVFM